MTPIRDFVGTLAVAGKSFKEIQQIVRDAYGDKAIKRTQIYDIIKKVKEGKPAADQRHLNSKRKKRSAAFIADVAADIENDRRVTVKKLAHAYGVSRRTIHLTLKNDLNLSKKSARWVPKLLTEDMKKERVRTSEAFLAMVRRRSMAMLDNIVTMDESAVSFHTPETKQQSRQWLPKGQPGPVKAKVHATRTKQMVLAFFDNKGLIYTNYVPRGTTVTARYIVDALGKFLKIFKKKRPVMAATDWWLHWDNAPVHTATMVTDWMAARQIQLIQRRPIRLTWPPRTFSSSPG
jgi:histone-lysine N-methyltransferase SETMAR